MKKINIFCICFLLLLFSGCDYFACYRFVVINNTDHEVVIKTSAKISDNGFYFADSIHTIKPGRKVEFFQDLGLCNKSYIPEDSYAVEDTIPKTSIFDVFVDGELNRTLRLRLNWEYESKTQVGIYTLRITPMKE
ncbi:hypothetical protein AGMMS50239_16200 [Bacteroidia bacterium]|nr:hypothetical protein AGMMS50239_16200 [Bacteroidia bacterium]